MKSEINPELNMTEKQYERLLSMVSPLVMMLPEVMAPAALDRLRRGHEAPLMGIYLRHAKEYHVPDVVEKAFDHFCSYLADPQQDPTDYLNTLHPLQMPVDTERLLEAGVSQPRWVVEGLLPQGLTVLAAPPKAGKSWLSLALCMAVASGKPFLGHYTHKGGVLYLDLEDSTARLAERVRKLCGQEERPKNLLVQLQASSLRQGLAQTMSHLLDNLFGTTLVVVDTLQKIRGVRTSQDVYGSDYADLGALKRIADERGIAILVVHHTRKGSEGSVFERISGSNGVTGAADTQWVLVKDKQGTTLHITGRDVCMEELPLQFNPETCRWETGQEEESQLAKVCSGLVSAHNGLWQGTAQDILNECIRQKAIIPANNPRQLSIQLDQEEDQLREKYGIRIERTRANNSRLIRLIELHPSR